MKIFESLFDITYLIIVVALGIRLLLEKNSNAKLFGIMAILLGVGDGFHLIPRIISHLSPGGFEAHSAALSWGEFVTSITMTIFYVLYYHYYRSQSGDRDNTKRNLIYILALARVILVLLPQNEWGNMPGNYMFGIYRNIPFLIMGIFLIYRTYRQREKRAFKYMSLLIFLSFLFYIPVVLFSRKYPIVGALMLPKTIAYLLIVILGFKYFNDKFELKNLLGISFTFLIMGLIAGVFYREFTKFFEYTKYSHLNIVHVHTLVLGFILLLVFYNLLKEKRVQEVKTIQKPLYVYLTGLTFTIINFVFIGIYEVVAEGNDIINRSAIDGISGLGHIILSVGLVRLFVKIYNLETKTDTFK